MAICVYVGVVIILHKYLSAAAKLGFKWRMQAEPGSGDTGD